jgi:hypothetical protein
VRKAIYVHDAIEAHASTFVVQRLWCTGIGLIGNEPQANLSVNIGANGRSAGEAGRA